ncbi:uroporphyrinogen-III synthase [Rhodoferax saidenbachensis]|uniref:Uroporphyrinogen-III synthase n=1 Tax=Rhodoferax saidenbachensis TaxID=1484693 RepID=A0ABU1ZLI6_9BURK|nr:uroporphyrinogen-III synthase [Rhodoferax saidenbachensis]MDR7306399.1 uroporphyrinogen-III synthase [Rhodoferax saidenbachensis]
MRVIVTRPQTEAAQWVQTLQASGYEAHSLPLIDVQPAAQPQAVREAWARMDRNQYDAVMFVSRNAVDHFFALKQAAAPVFIAQAAIKSRAFVTGPGSYSALLRAGAEPGCIDAPAQDTGQFDSEALWAVVQQRVVPGFRLLIVRGTTAQGDASDEGVGRDWFARKATAAGAVVDFVVAYQRQRPVLPAGGEALIGAAATDGSVWLFSSSEAIANLQAWCPQQAWQQARAVVTHPRIGQAARAAGFGTVRESKPALAALMASIESL